jgi:hypothetical protein
MPDEISDEDRERLVQAKFSELFDHNWDRRFAEEFDKRVTEMSKSSKSAPTKSNDKSDPPTEKKVRRSSMLDKALGIG